MASIEENILTAIKAKGRGSIFFPSDFTSYGEVKAIGKSLERLTAKGDIIRLARGIYLYPEIDTVLGLGILMPSIEQIAEMIARRDKARIVPTGIYALNKLGISTQVPMNIVYLTDGAPRKVSLGNGRSIQFKYTTPKNLSFTNSLAMLVTFALKEVGKDNITDDIAKQIKNVLQKEQKENVLADEALMPAWIRTFTRQAYIWGFEGDLTKKQIKRLRKASSIFVRDELCQSLQRAVTETGMEKWLLVEADPDGEGDGTYPEPRVIHIRYRSLFDEDLPYLHSEVKLEVGARSLLEPTAEATVTSIVEDALPISTIVKQVVIPTALAEKTFLEKAFLLHELFSSQTSREANRKSRHLYDLAQMMSTDIATRAIANDELWNTIHHHRELFTSMSGVDYTPDIRKRIRLLPPDDVMDDWYNDYKDMQSSMIYGEKPSFEELIEKMRELENLFHNTKH